MTLKEMPKVGDKVRYLGVFDDEASQDITIGNTYEISGIDDEGNAFFIDDVGDFWYVVEDFADDFELVITKGDGN